MEFGAKGKGLVEDSAIVVVKMGRELFETNQMFSKEKRERHKTLVEQEQHKEKMAQIDALLKGRLTTNNQTIQQEEAQYRAREAEKQAKKDKQSRKGSQGSRRQAQKRRL